MSLTKFMPPGRMQRRSRPLNQTAGFTLVELLIVIALIALLAALSIGALIVLPERARVRGTEATITKLSTALERKVTAIQQRRSSIRPSDTDDTGVTTSGVDTFLCGGNLSRAQLIALIRTLRQELPEQFGTSPSNYSTYDLHYSPPSTPPPPPGTPVVKGDWNQIDLTAPPLAGPRQPARDLPSGAQLFEAAITRAIKAGTFLKHTPETTRAELLYLILSGTGGDGGGSEEFAPGEIEDTDGDGLPEFVDKWKRPIQFFMWPTHHESEHPSLGSASNANDPNQLLIDSSWLGDIQRRPAYERLFHWVTRDGPTVTAPPAAVQARAYPTIPLIVSAGPDGEFGLLTDPTTGQFDSRAMRDPASGGFDDNIDNHTLRVR